MFANLKATCVKEGLRKPEVHDTPGEGQICQVTRKARFVKSRKGMTREEMDKRNKARRGTRKTEISNRKQRDRKSETKKRKGRYMKDVRAIERLEQQVNAQIDNGETRNGQKGRLG